MLIASIILIEFFLLNLCIFVKVIDKVVFNLHSDPFVEFVVHVHPGYIRQFDEQPSPFFLLPSSHWYFITTPSPHI